MKYIIFLLFLLPVAGFSQGVVFKPGDRFPAIPINNMINAPTSSVNINQMQDNKFYILNFWGTWCGPCLPEMDALTNLQKKNASKMQVIAISDDPDVKLRKYLNTMPTTIWLAADTNYLLYSLFNFASVSHSAILNPKKEIVALVKTHTITQGLLDSLYKGLKVKSDADLKEMPVSKSDDVFNVDSTLMHSFTVRGYMRGQGAMSKIFRGSSVYAGRRLNFVNTGITNLYKTAFNIVSTNQIIYEVDEKSVNNYQDKSQRYCVDILVKPEDKDSLYSILQHKLNATLPVKGKIVYQTIPVYVITNENFALPISDKKTSYSFSGRGYDGTAVTISDFANDYLSNELPLPVVDETNLKGKFDIKTAIEMRTQAEVLKSITSLGLKIEKQERKMRMLVLY